MKVSRRHTIGLLGSTLAAPYILRPAAALEAIEYIKVCEVKGTGYNDIAHSDLAIGPLGFRVGWIDSPSISSARAYTRTFELDGTPKSGAVQLGNPAGPTDGSRANRIACEDFSDGNGLCFFGAQAIGATLSQSTEIYSQDLNALSVEQGSPIRINGPLDGGYAGLFSSVLPNGNVAAAYTYNTVAGFDVRLRITDAQGNPLFPERVVAGAAGGVEELCTGLDINPDFIFCSFARFYDGATIYRVQLIDPSNGRNVGQPVTIKPPTGQQVFGAPSVAPSPLLRPFVTLMANSDASNDEVGLYGAPYTMERSSLRGPHEVAEAFVKLGSHKVDLAENHFFNRPESVRLANGDVFVITDSLSDLIGWLVKPNGQLRAKRTFRRTNGRMLRSRRLRRLGNLLGLLWYEYDPATQDTLWRVQLFRIQLG